MNPLNPNPFAYPQRSAAPISTSIWRDQETSVDVLERETSAKQSVTGTGGAVPIVYGKFQNNSGGVWLSPPAARYGLQRKPDTMNDEFSFGMIISDGQVGQIAEADIYKGSDRLSELNDRRYVNAYGFMPSSGFDYSFTESVATPGTPGTDDQVVTSSSNYAIDQTVNWTWNDRNYAAFYSTGATSGINCNLVGTINGAPVSFLWQIVVNNSVVASGSGNGSAGISYSTSSNKSFKVTIKAPNSSMGNFINLRLVGTGTRSDVTVTPGTPGTPPVYTDSSLPLSAGSGGTFEGISCLAVKGSYVDEKKEGLQDQIRCFIRNGLKVENLATGVTESSSNFIDLAYYLLKANKVSDALIDLDAFKTARAFLEVNKLRYNGVIAASVNLRSFFSAVAPGLMLSFVQDAGKFSFRPVLPLTSDGKVETGTTSVKKSFSNENILQGSYRKEYYESRMRKPFCALISWREQQKQKYSALITTEMRYNGTAIDGPFETYDYSDFVTDVNHASMLGRYVLSSRARITHSISFSTYFDGLAASGERLAGQLEPMDIIRVSLTSETNGTPAADSDLYQVSRISESGDGNLRIEAIHFPSDDAGASLVAADVMAVVPITGDPGGDGGGGTAAPVYPSIGVLSISPNETLYSDGKVVTLTASYDGGAKNVSYSWSGPAGSGAPLGTTGNVLSWTASGAGDAGAYTVTATSPTAPDSPRKMSAGLTYEPFPVLSGGTVTTSGNFRIHTFTSSGTLTVDTMPTGGTVEYLICGPGGTVESTHIGRGGGGGGGVLTGNKALTVGSYPITVGVPTEYNVQQGTSNTSTAFGLTARCGGGNVSRTASSSKPAYTANGGCGGGANSLDYNALGTPQPGTAVPGTGSQGGSGSIGSFSAVTVGSYRFYTNGGGGGGGAGGANGTSGSSSQAGRGGQGVTSSISGSSYVYGSGGAGSLVKYSAGGSVAPGGTGAGSGALKPTGGAAIIRSTPPTNYGAGASADVFKTNRESSTTKGMQGVVIVRYRYK